MPFIIFYQHGTHTYANRTSQNNEYEQYKLAEYKATCNTTVPKLCYDIVMVRQSHGWSQRTNFKTCKSTHERIMIIMTSSSRTKSNSCAAVQVESAGSVVTVSLVPSQCSDTRVSNTQKTIDLEDDQMLHTHMPSTSHSCSLLQLQPQFTTKIFAVLINASFHFEI